MIAILVDPTHNDRYEDAMARAKSIILDRVKDHIVPHIVEKNTAQGMWEALTKLYQHTSVQRKMLLENQLRSYQMKKREQIDPFLSRLEEIRDQLTAIKATPDQELMVRTTLNVVSEDWEVFVQSILGRALSHLGTRCGRLFARKRSDDNRRRVAAARGSKKNRRRKMLP